MNHLIQGPDLPYKVLKSAMVSSDENGVILVGGEKYVGYQKSHLGSLLAMKDIVTGWKEIDLPDLNQLRKDHVALVVNENEKGVLCGKLTLLKIFCLLT